MPRIAYKIFYDGTVFNGFSGNPESIEEYLKRAFKKFNEDVKLLKASRTDPGVSAIGNVIAVDLSRIVLPEQLNSKLPESIRVWAWSIVDNTFNPRKASSRTYMYVKLYEDEDLELMRSCAHLFIGTHNLKNFTIGDDKLRSVVYIHDISIIRSGNYIYFTITGKSFRNKMIRKIVWTLVSVGRGKLSINYVKDLIDCKIERTVPSIDPEGLILLKVKYRPEITFKICEKCVIEISKYLENKIKSQLLTTECYSIIRNEFLNILLSNFLR